MKCALCGNGTVAIKSVWAKQEMNGETFDVYADAFVCESCGGHYWDNELADKLIKATEVEFLLLQQAKVPPTSDEKIPGWVTDMQFDTIKDDESGGD